MAKKITLNLHNFHAFGLVDTGTSWDPQDPSLSVTVGEKTFHTERIKDAGTEAFFPEHFTYTLPNAVLPDVFISIDAWNESYNGNKKHLGCGRIQLGSIVNHKSPSSNNSLLIELYSLESKKGSSLSGNVRFFASILTSTVVGDYPAEKMSSKQQASEQAVNVSHQPYTISVTIFRAENLPVADFTSSDPFVVINIDNTIIGKTKTISRNLNPVWGQYGEGEEFRFDSLHVNKTLVFNIYDANTTTDDVLLGTVRVPLNERANSLPENFGKPNLPVQYFITLAEKFKGKGREISSELMVSIVVKKNDSLVRIKPDSSTATGRSIPLAYRDLLSNENITTVLPKSTGEAVTATLNGFLTDETESFVDRDLFIDLLRDLRSITAMDDSLGAESNDLDFFRRNNLRIFNGRKIEFLSREGTRFPPIEANSLQLNLTSDCSRYVVVQLANRFAMWTWAKWFFLLHDFWRQRVHNSQIPSWAEAGEFYGQVSVNNSEGLTVQGRGYVSFKRPFQIKVNETVVDLVPLTSIVLSADADKPKKHLLDVEIVSVEYLQDSTADRERESVIIAEPGAITRRKSGLFSTVRDAVKGAGSVASTVVSGARDVGLEVATGVASTTVSAARTIASGPITAIVAAQDTVLGAGKDIASILTNTPKSVIGQPNAFAVVHYGNLKHHTARLHPNQQDWGQHFFLETDRIQKKTKSVTEPASDNNPAAFFPIFDDENVNLNVFLLRGNEGSEKLTGQKSISTQELMKVKDDIRISTSSLTTYTDNSQEIDFDLDSNIGLSITVLQGANLKLPANCKASSQDSTNAVSNAIDSVVSGVSYVVGSNFTLNALYWKFNLVDENGHKVEKCRTVKSSISPISTNPHWNDQNSVIFTAADGLTESYYVRAELTATSQNNVAIAVSVGAIFIPIQYFTKTEKQYVFSMRRFRQTTKEELVESFSGFGEITVLVKRIKEKIPNVFARLKFRTTLLERNIFNTAWYAECLPSGDLDSDVALKNADNVTVAFSTDGLLLLDVTHFGMTIESGLSLAKDRSPHISRDDKLDLMSNYNSVIPDAAAQSMIEVEVFENQRRGPPILDWSKNAISRPNFSDLTYNRAFTGPLSSASPPAGFDWRGDWFIDKDYIPTDSNGWCYGITFSAILSQYYQKKSSTTPLKNFARRRKWVRKAVKISVPHDSRLLSLSRTLSIKSEPLTPPLQKLSKISSDWRIQAYSDGCRSILGLCRERIALGTPIQIPWNQVSSVSMITESVLSLHFEVDRLFMSEDSQSYKFNKCWMEMFVSNCPAAELRSLSDERIWCDRIRLNMKQLMISGVLTVPTYNAPTTDEEEEDETNDAAASDGVPETEDLSMGSQVIAELDNNSLVLEARTKELSEIYRKNPDPSIYKEMTVLVRRNLRLRLYMAALLGAGLKGGHSFTDTDIRSLLEKDFKKGQNIELDNDVATANNRIEYLLDTAEQRVRDTALCGWENKGGALERSLELVVNGFFIEIINQLAIFFESHKMQALKGLTSKVELISTFMNHNDRLSIILNSTLRPFNLVATPDPKLSLYLSCDTLLQWYSSAIHAEMRMHIDNIFAVYRDTEKDASGLASQYKYPLPWIPGRSSGDAGVFKTTIRLDVVDVLSTYLENAKIKKDVISESFLSQAHMFDATLFKAYINAFSYLAEHYQKALQEKSWFGCSTEELEEYMEFLCSVANDAFGTKNYSLFREGYDLSETPEDIQVEMTALHKSISAAFAAVQHAAVDQLSCVVLDFVFRDRPDTLQNDSCKTWLAASWREVGSADSQDDFEDQLRKGFVPELMNDLEELMTGKMNADYLEADCFASLLSILADKVIFYMFRLIQCLSEEKSPPVVLRSDGPELKQLNFDIMSIKKSIMQLSTELSDPGELQTLLLQKFAVLDNSYTVLSGDSMSTHFTQALKSFADKAQEQPVRALALAATVEACIKLRGVRMDQLLISTTSKEDSSTADHNNSRAKRSNSILPRYIGGALSPTTTNKSGGGGRQRSDSFSDMEAHHEVLLQRLEVILGLIRQSAATSPVTQQTKTTTTIDCSIPEHAAFINSKDFKQPTRELMLQSYLPASERSKHALHKSRSFLTNLMGSTLSKEKSVKIVSNVQTGSSRNNWVKVSGLQLQNLLNIDLMSSTKTYLVVNSCGGSVKTSTKYGSNPSWEDEDPIMLGPNIDSKQNLELKITIFNANIFSSIRVGTFTTYIDPTVSGGEEKKAVVIKQREAIALSSDRKIAAAEKAAVGDGKPLPCISFKAEIVPK